MKKWIKRILAALLILVLVCVLAFCGLYLGRFKTLASIRKVSAYEDGYNLYRMDIKYDYSLDDIIASGITNDQSMVDAIVKIANGHTFRGLGGVIAGFFRNQSANKRTAKELNHD